MYNSPKATLKATNHSHEPDEDAEFLEKLENNKRHLLFFDTKFTKFIKSLSTQRRGRFFDLYEEAGKHLTLQGLGGADLDREKWLMLGDFSVVSRHVFERPCFAITKDTKEWDLLQEVHFAWIAWGLPTDTNLELTIKGSIYINLSHSSVTTSLSLASKSSPPNRYIPRHLATMPTIFDHVLPNSEFRKASKAEKDKASDYLSSLSWLRTCQFWKEYEAENFKQLKTKEQGVGRRELWDYLARKYPRGFTRRCSLPLDKNAIEYKAYKFVQEQYQIHVDFRYCLGKLGIVM
ncbi:hypothetical protein HYFRA_00010659 [Hymenoscyphus fraxineus]|uniref:Uncharacterized protein n=1 Tax=Hymenoscyphus fraxineus TaxID=746836 RepID=A0A9N9L9J4_9HELO|nr:hypothetical protein HYFRA_00010659 [Hymenoscyphus fraxineus]